MARTDRALPPVDGDLKTLLVHIMMRPSPPAEPPWENSPRLAQLVAGSVVTGLRVLMMSELRYASPLLLEITGSLFLAVAQWRESGDTTKWGELSGEICIALDHEAKLFEHFTRDHILPPDVRVQVVQALIQIRDVVIREGIIPSIRENHRYLSLITVLQRGGSADLEFLGKLYRGIARYHSHQVTDWCQSLVPRKGLP